MKGVTQGENTLKFEKRETKSTPTRINRTKDLFINRSDRERERKALPGGHTVKHRGRGRQSFDAPLKDLPNYKKQGGDWQCHPQIPCLRIDLAITVLQISPSQTLGEPQTLLPEDFTHPLQHTAEQCKKK